ncbi:MAG TPA: cell envelope biogenesis protein TolA [Croceibacterium sp.]|nr:cell envelope biogenesis protein TolA [Croceibacterium sp.]
MERSERIGLGIATAGHVLLIAVLSFGLLQRDVAIPPSPPAIDVSIADAVSLRSTTTAPAVPQQAQAPEQGVTEPDATPPPPAPEPEEMPVAQPRDVAPPTPAPTPKPTPTPAPPKAQPKPQPKAETPKKPTPAAKPAPAKPSPSKVETAKPKPQRASRLGADFLKGLDDARPSRPTPAPAASAPMGAVAARALNAEINRQIKPYWRPPSGADADRLVTLLSVHLDRSGAVVGEIEVVDQQGITPSNRAQAALHAERAVQAVRRASPFQNLPAEYYDQWKWLKPLKFDARLAQ